MYKNDIEYFERAIKRAHKRYTGERIDGPGTLLEVANLFNIPVDETRIDDYIIKTINYSIPSIEIFDEKNDTSYMATYTDQTDLLNYRGKVNSVVSISPSRKEESVYHIGGKTPIITKMTLTDGMYDLVFEREMAHSTGVFVNSDATKMAVRYLQGEVCDGENIEQLSFNRIYKNKNINGKLDGTYEQVYTRNTNHFIKCGNTQDKYAYIINNNVIYGINELEQKGFCNYLYGICFESLDILVDDYFPCNMEAKDYPLLSEEATDSAMIFIFGTGHGIHHSFQAYKGKDAISVMYSSKEYLSHVGHQEKITANEKYVLPNLSEGTISSQEVQSILSSLQTKLEDDTAFDIISNELNTFGTKIDIRKGNLQAEVDPLSPTLFIDRSFDDIYALISANKDDYFKLVSEQFMSVVDIDQAIERGQSKVLLPSGKKK